MSVAVVDESDLELEVAAPGPVFGVSYDLDAERYHELDALGSGDVKELATRSPAHFIARREARGGKSTEARVRGFATHLAILEPEKYEGAVAVVPADAPDRPTAAMLNAKERTPASERRVAFWRDFDAAAAGRVVISAATHDAVRRMSDSVRRHPAARALLEAGAREVSLLWRDEATGTDAKARVDWLRPEIAAVDVKTTTDASLRGFPREAARYGYVIQAAHYELGARAVLRKPFDFWTWIAVEPEPPYAVGVYAADPPQVERAIEIVERAYALHARCRAAGAWPAYSDLIEPISLPEWAF